MPLFYLSSVCFLSVKKKKLNKNMEKIIKIGWFVEEGGLAEQAKSGSVSCISVVVCGGINTTCGNRTTFGPNQRVLRKHFCLQHVDGYMFGLQFLQLLSPKTF